MRFENKVCLITGGASGIGAKTAEMFVGQGGKAVIVDINDELGIEVSEQIGTDDCLYLHVDVTDPQACQSAVEYSVEQFGGVDCTWDNKEVNHSGWYSDGISKIISNIECGQCDLETTTATEAPFNCDDTNYIIPFPEIDQLNAGQVGLFYVILFYADSR